MTNPSFPNLAILPPEPVENGSGPITRTVLGHPRGLWFLAFTEAGERFSFYGMQTLLVLYMVDRLLLPGHIENIVGFATLRNAIEIVYGSLTTQGLASAIFGFYAGAVYLTPLLGGFLADRVLGRHKTVLLGGALMALGHFLMAFEQPFLLALACIVLGSGCFKGNLAAQVGGLYPKKDHRSADAFQIYYLAINCAVIPAPLICGTLGERVGWHWGFFAAGIGMLLSMSIYLSGTRHLPPDTPQYQRGIKTSRKFSAKERKITGLLILLLPVFAALIIGNQEIFNAYLVWAQGAADFTFFGHSLPISWLITFDSLVMVVCLGGSVLFWQTWGKRWPEPDEFTKILIGSVFVFTALLILSAAAAWSEKAGSKVGIGWLAAFHILNNIGCANILPVSLALYSRSAPQFFGSTILGFYFLHLVAANILVGYIGGLLHTVSDTQFWLIHVAIVGGAALVLVVVKSIFDAVSRSSS